MEVQGGGKEKIWRLVNKFCFISTERYSFLEAKCYIVTMGYKHDEQADCVALAPDKKNLSLFLKHNWI